MRILHTESSMHLGGQELRILLEMEGLVQYGCRSVLAARPGTRIVEEAALRGLKTFTLKMRGSVDPVAVCQLLSILRREQIDLVSAHGSKDGWSAGLAARLLGLPVIRCRHVANPIRRHGFGRLVYGPLCDRIVTTSESIKAGMVDRGVRPEKIVSVPTGISPERFHLEVEKGTFRQGLGIDRQTPLIGMITVLRGDKGPDVFIRTAEHFLTHRPDAQFALVGDGWMRPKLETMLENSPWRRNIRLTGFRRDIPQVMADLDVLVLSAKIPEGVPQTILQAHAMEVPVIASDVGGVNEVAIDGVTALTVPPRDPERLAASILEVLECPEEARLRAKAGREMVLSRYTVDRTLESMFRIYESAWKRKRNEARSSQ